MRLANGPITNMHVLSHMRTPLPTLPMPTSPAMVRIMKVMANPMLVGGISAALVSAIESSVFMVSLGRCDLGPSFDCLGHGRVFGQDFEQWFMVSLLLRLVGWFC